jgi:hypothetical protein
VACEAPDGEDKEGKKRAPAVRGGGTGHGQRRECDKEITRQYSCQGGRREEKGA